MKLQCKTIFALLSRFKHASPHINFLILPYFKAIEAPYQRCWFDVLFRLQEAPVRFKADLFQYAWCQLNDIYTWDYLENRAIFNPSATTPTH